MSSYGGSATDELIDALADMPSSWAQAHLFFFIRRLSRELESRNRSYRHTLLETFATELAEGLGGEVDWDPRTSGDDTEPQEIALEWYALGHADGEEGMAPEPRNHASQWAKLP